MSNVHTIRLNDGTIVPTLSFGTGTALYSKDSTTAVRQAISKAGYTHIDCAEAYGNERYTAQAIQDSNVPREQLFLTSKCWSKDPRKSLEKTLEELKTTYVDLYLIHSPIQTPNIAEAWKIMEDLKAEGKARSIGVSNFRAKDLKVLLEGAKVIPSVNQIEMHPYVFASIQPVLQLCRQHNITIESYGPLTPLIRHPGGPVDEPVKKVAARMAKGPEVGVVTEGQVLLKWAQQRTNGVIITTSSKLDRLSEQKAALDLPPLSNEELRSIETEGAKKHYRHFMKHMDDA
ncbi:NAD/NADP-dependent indole-3-acetaldehyde reductase OS=Schizosaccharomyces pombe (strain 972 / ATCC 24843) GN=SPAC19G12,09 PE=1 SV=1 [Rhizoctonia solani AG-1 IB]|uniref:NAD/NADP-dependent indole-3-acetaldehyde reductase n=1 Tax=Thanatephorus cucumeris (strain AG1-IB / isolate 7/3/14) TaxID=1108050 RepID=A0A0B7FJE5_THACB|nr:NAD/NADP-dependent indole-3-acetaldehyde reductase OS=Schizosaccharomyces pombe (strain 972 / ATCC 24843) GN=SPAC19G12,09 PE=1 SV=1 [Rhizoctonia solani AG-1 IB]